MRGLVSKEDDAVRMVGEAAAELGGLDALVNNAGIQISRPSHELSSADFDKVLAVNLRGAFLCAREAINRRLLPGQRRRGLHHRPDPLPQLPRAMVERVTRGRLSRSGTAGTGSRPPRRPRRA